VWKFKISCSSDSDLDPFLAKNAKSAKELGRFLQAVPSAFICDICGINIGAWDSSEDKRSCALETAPMFSTGVFPRKIWKFHSMEVPDFSPQRTQRTTEKQPQNQFQANALRNSGY
jgi:hypothetical protein